MSSETKKVVNLDRPREGAAEERPGSPAAPAAKDDVDRLLSDFLDQINSLSAELGAGTVPEPGEQITPEPETSVSQNIVNMAAALKQQPGPAAASPVEDTYRDAAPLPFGRDTSDFDEEIERALSALEELPPQKEEMPAEPVGRTQAATVAAAELAAASPTLSVAETEPSDEAVQQPAEVDRETVKTSDAVAPAPAAYEEVRPVFSYSPYVPGSRRLLIALAILAAVALLIFGVYLFVSRSRPVPPAVGAQTSTAPPLSETPAVSPEPVPEASQPESTAPSSINTRPEQAANNRVAKEGRMRTPTGADRTSRGRTEPETSVRQAAPQPDSAPPAPAVVEQTAVPVVQKPQQSAPAAAAPEPVAPPPQTPMPLNTPSSSPSGAPAAPTTTSPARNTESGNAAAESGGPAGAAMAPATPPSVPKPAPQPAATTTAPRVSKPAASPAVRSATPAELISRVLPSFPEFARRMNQTGQVDLEIEIDAQGRVTKATPIGGPPIFHDAATQAVRKWRFKPATLDGNNVASHGKVTVVFNKR